jgi:hypothetical protein
MDRMLETLRKLRPAQSPLPAAVDHPVFSDTLTSSPSAPLTTTDISPSIPLLTAP